LGKGPSSNGTSGFLDDWVRRVAFLGKDLFVGTASTGVQRFRLGDNEPRQRYAVMGKSSVFVEADHQAGTDPETSVTSLWWDGRWLAAGLAGGHLHVWGAEGEPILAVVAPGQPRPCYVSIVEDMVVSATDTVLQRRRLGATANPQVVDAAVTLPSRVHCLTPAPKSGVIVGMEDGSVEIRGADFELVACHKVSTTAVSAICVADDGLLTGDATGEVVFWRGEADGGRPLGFPCTSQYWQPVWRARHNGRVVAVRLGGDDSVVTGALDGTVRVWSCEDGELRFGIGGHKVWLGSICIDDDKGLMVTDGRDNAVYLYNFCSEE